VSSVLPRPVPVLFTISLFCKLIGYKRELACRHNWSHARWMHKRDTIDMFCDQLLHRLTAIKITQNTFTTSLTFLRQLTFCNLLLVTSPPAAVRSIAMGTSVCLFVCLFALINNQQPHGQTSPIFVRVAYGRCSILRWWRCNALCTSGFVDAVIFSHKGFLMARHTYS